MGNVGKEGPEDSSGGVFASVKNRRQSWDVNDMVFFPGRKERREKRCCLEEVSKEGRGGGTVHGISKEAIDITSRKAWGRGAMLLSCRPGAEDCRGAFFFACSQRKKSSFSRQPAGKEGGRLVPLIGEKDWGLGFTFRCR